MDSPKKTVIGLEIMMGLMKQKKMGLLKEKVTGMTTEKYLGKEMGLLKEKVMEMTKEKYLVKKMGLLKEKHYLQWKEKLTGLWKLMGFEKENLTGLLKEKEKDLLMVIAMGLMKHLDFVKER